MAANDTPVDPEAMVQMFLAGFRARTEELTKPDGPFPMAEEEVEHFGTTQKYRCWQRGPNSLTCLTMPELFADAGLRYGDKEFLCYEGSDRWTYSSLFGAAAALARALMVAPYSIKKGDCMAVAGRNTPEWVTAFVAGTGHLGAVVLPVNSWWIGEELEYGLKDSGTKVFFADPEVLARAPFLADLGVKAVCMRAGSEVPKGVSRMEELIKLGRDMLIAPAVAVKPDDRAMLMYTSGTTSKPKGVVMTHRGVMAAMNTVRMFNSIHEQMPQQGVSLLGSPLFHVNGSHVALLAAVAVGGKLVMMRKWNATRALELVQQERITNLVGVPTMTYELVNSPDFGRFDTSSLQGVGGGGSAFAAPMIKRVEQKFKNAKAGTGYGLTETNAVTAVMPAPIFPLRPTSCGIPVVTVDVCIIDEQGKVLPPGEMGEICIRGSSIMREYWNKPDKTAEVFHFDSEGRLWFKSGDLGTLDKDGFVYITDRAKDIIIRGGENISCAEVEAALFEHPSVAEVAAIGVPHATLGEAVAVVLCIKKGEAAPSIAELSKHTVARLAAFKVPAEYHFWQEDTLPRGATGKVQKREIRDKLKAAREPSSKL